MGYFKCTCEALGKQGPYFEISTYCSPIKSKEEKTNGEDCPDCGSANGGAVGMNTYPVKVQKVNSIIKSITGEDLKVDELNFLYSQSNENEVTDEIILFFKKNGTTEETVAFILEAIKVFMNDGDVDFEDRIFELFEGTDTDCVNDKMKEINPNDPNITLYHRLLNKFNDATNNWLVFEVGSTTNGNWGETSGSWLNSLNSNGSLPDTYNITISNTIDQNGSNLAKEITLIHELIHAYMFDTLSDAGLITFLQNGEPVLNVTCLNGVNYSNVNLNSLTSSEKFIALICAMQSNGTLTQQWTHDLFNTNTFSVTSYQQQIKDFILNNHDWNSELQIFETTMQNTLGNNWESKVADFISWRGLENTQEFHNWYISSSYTTGIDNQGNTTYPDMVTTISNVQLLGNSNCN